MSSDPDAAREAHLREWVAHAETSGGGRNSELAFLLRLIDEARAQYGWRPIEAAPRHGNYVRVYAEEGVLYCPNGGEATRWMPLPEPPAE